MSFNWHNVRTLGSLSGAVCYLFTHSPLHLGTDMRSLLPFLAFPSAFGHWEALSVTYSCFSHYDWALRWAFCYLSLHFPLRLGTEMGSLLPFLANFSAFGHWHAFSVTFPCNLLWVRALRGTLCYLFMLFPLHSGTDMRSLLPFHAIFSEFGHWEALSVTYSCFSHYVRALRRALCYLYM